MIIAGHLAGQGRTHPARTALEDGSRSIGYGPLAAEARAVGARMRALGVARDAPLALLCESRAEVMLAYYGAAAVGAVFVPINPSLTPREVAYIVEHCGARILVHDEATAAAAGAAVAACRRAPLAAILDGEAPAVPAGATAAPDEDFLVIYTSGTTGQPKAVVFSQAAEFAGNAALIEMWGLTERDVTLVALPLGFLYGLSTAAAAGIQAGGKVVVLRRFRPKDVLDALVAHHATIFHGVPTMFSMMLDYAEQNRISVDLSFMRLLISAGAPLSGETKARFAATFGKAIDDYYALTEVRPVFGRRWDDTARPPVGAIGRAAPGAEIRIVDADGRALPAGEQGELLVQAASTLTRYHRNDVLTRAALADGLFRTGDLGYRDGEGFYHLTGRIKDIIIRGGANIAPAEVEEAIARHPSVQQAAVIGAPEPKYGEVVVAFVVGRHGATPDIDALAAHCRGLLAEFKVPAAFVPLASMPLGITGKIDKKALLKLWTEAKP
jgi:long-chain acyl-CoA synthetase